MNKNPKSCLVRILIAFFSLLGLCIILSAIATLSNRSLPTEQSSATLDPVDKARLLEALHLKKELGNQIWPGWGDVDHPVILWNRSYEFLVNYIDGTPAGWQSANDEFNGQVYLRRTADDPQNFALKVGDTWVPSMATKQTTDRFLIDTFRDNFPSPIKEIFPYRLLLQPSETQLGAVLHEDFHVYQYQNAPVRMAQAESIHKLGNEYQAAAQAFLPEWKQESKLLADALTAKTAAEKIELVRQFIQARDARRSGYRLTEQLIDYERWLEWEEGTAKYIEVGILKKAGETLDYRAVPEMENDPDFKQYTKTGQRWSQELFQLRHQTTSGESQFYMTGLAQAFLLDDLMPGWQDQYWKDGVFLEDLLRQATQED